MTGYYIISILVHTLYFLHVHIFIYNSRLLTAIVLWESSLCWLGNIQVGKKIRNSHMAYMWHIHTYVHIYICIWNSDDPLKKVSKLKTDFFTTGGM